MAKKSTSSNMRRKVTFYKTEAVWDRMSASYLEKWVPAFTRYCEMTPIYREALKTYIGGGAVMRDRQEFTTRYDPRINRELRCEYGGVMYEISIAGDTTGNLKEVRFLGEAIVNGGM